MTGWQEAILYDYHRIGYDEFEEFDYDAYKANGFSVPNPAEAPLGPEPRGLIY